MVSKACSIGGVDKMASSGDDDSWSEPQRTSQIGEQKEANEIKEQHSENPEVWRLHAESITDPPGKD